jgi:hypothetical protein
MVVGFIITYVIGAYHHQRFAFEPRWCEVYSIQHYVIKFACKWLTAGRLFSPDIPVSSTNKTDIHDITELLLKVALKTTHLGQSHCHLLPIWFIFVWFTSSWHGCSWNTAQLTLNGIAQSIFLDHSNIIDLSVTLPLNIFHCRFCVSDIFLTLYKPCHFSFR